MHDPVIPASSVYSCFCVPFCIHHSACIRGMLFNESAIKRLDGISPKSVSVCSVIECGRYLLNYVYVRMCPVFALPHIMPVCQGRCALVHRPHKPGPCTPIRRRLGAGAAWSASVAAGAAHNPCADGARRKGASGKT